MKIPSPSELSAIALQAAQQAGALLRSGFGTSFEISSKEGRHNLVTEYDRSSEQLIIETIRSHFPTHAFLAEESGETKKGGSPVVWIIDPLDGTVNFAHGIPIFSISIAAAIGAEVVCGIVYQPLSQELFSAEKGQGAFLKGKQLRVSTANSLEESLLSTGFPYNVEENPLQCVEKFAEMQLKGIPIRRLGSAALDLAYVAAGRFDGFWEVGLHPWDMAAGKLLVEEAGGTVTHWNGSLHTLFGYQTIVATNGRLHQEIVAHLIR
jgi:myo-inositol-1(or 4)-monophosphatase